MTTEKGDPIPAYVVHTDLQTMKLHVTAEDVGSYFVNRDPLPMNTALNARLLYLERSNRHALLGVEHKGLKSIAHFYQSKALKRLLIATRDLVVRMTDSTYSIAVLWDQKDESNKPDENDPLFPKKNQIGEERVNTMSEHGTHVNCVQHLSDEVEYL